MTFLLNALLLGLVFAFLALGILISFRIFAFADITTDGSLTLGACSCAALLIHGVHPAVATVAGFAAGCFGGVFTAVLYTRCNINGLLAGILVVPTLYALSMRVIGAESVTIPEQATLAHTGHGFLQSVGDVHVDLSQEGPGTFLALLAMLGPLIVGVVFVLNWFFRTRLGVAMRAVGDNPVMVRGLGIDIGAMTIIGLAMANGLAGLAGALLAQYHGHANLQMGVGMIVWGLASVMIGETLLPGKKLLRMLLGAVLGAMVFRVILNLVLTTGLHPSDLKFFSSMFVLAMLLLPVFQQRLARAREKSGHA